MALCYSLSLRGITIHSLMTEALETTLRKVGYVLTKHHGAWVEVFVAFRDSWATEWWRGSSQNVTFAEGQT